MTNYEVEQFDTIEELYQHQLNPPKPHKPEDFLHELNDFVWNTLYVIGCSFILLTFLSWIV